MPQREYKPDAAPLSVESDPALKPPESDNENSFLDQVLQATGASDALRDEVFSSSREGFLNVAREFRGTEFAVDPVAHALIDVVLKQTLNERLVSEESRMILSRQIAERLVADPTAAPRLNAFWSKLQDAVA